MLGLGEKSPKKRASQSRPVLGKLAGFIQPPCSRQRMCIFVSARLHATAAPDAPAPMINTSTGSLIPVSLSIATYRASTPGQARAVKERFTAVLKSALCSLCVRAQEQLRAHLSL